MLFEFFFEVKEDFFRLGMYNIIIFGIYYWVLKNEVVRKILLDIFFYLGNFFKYIIILKICIMIVYEIMIKIWGFF